MIINLGVEAMALMLRAFTDDTGGKQNDAEAIG
jgi:hypothetical protein